jgi:hypothetical protein
MVIDKRTERFVKRRIFLNKVINVIRSLINMLRRRRVDKPKNERPDVSKIINKYSKIITHTKLSRSDATTELRSMIIELGSIPPMSIAQARKIIRESFKRDPDFKRTYIANISMRVFYDQMGIEDASLRDKMSESILDLIFEE